MGILTRLNTLAQANLGELTDRVTDPGAKVTLLLHEMRNHLATAKREIRELLVLEKRLEKEHKKLQSKNKNWEERATKAVKLGDDELARQCLYQRFEVEKTAKEVAGQLEESRAYVRQLLAASKRLEARVKSLHMRENTLKAKARGGASTDAFAEFGRIEDSIEGQMAENELDAELDPGAKALEEELLKNKLSDLERSSQADDELARLKKQVSSPHANGSAVGVVYRKPGSTPNRSEELAGDDELQTELDAIRYQLTDEWKLEDSLEDLKRKLDKEDPKETGSDGV